jgi:hypothetical protein
LGLRDLGRLLVDAVDIFGDHHARVMFGMLDLRLQLDQLTEVGFRNLHPRERLRRLRVFQNCRQALAGREVMQSSKPS